MSRRLFAESLLCGFALLAVAVWADGHSGYAHLATLPAVALGLPLFLPHWPLPGLPLPHRKEMFPGPLNGAGKPI